MLRVHRYRMNNSRGHATSVLVLLGLLFAGAGLRLFRMLVGKDTRGRDIGNGCLQFVLPAADNIAFPVHHGVEANPGNFCRIVLLRLADRRVHQVGALEEFGLRRPRHQAADSDAAVLQFLAKGKREAVYERLAAIVDRLMGSRHKAGDRSRQQNAPLSATAHEIAHLLYEIDRADDVGVDYLWCSGEVLVENPLPRPRPALACFTLSLGGTFRNAWAGHTLQTYSDGAPMSAPC